MTHNALPDQTWRQNKKKCPSFTNKTKTLDCKGKMFLYQFALKKRKILRKCDFVRMNVMILQTFEPLIFPIPIRCSLS